MFRRRHPTGAGDVFPRRRPERDASVADLSGRRGAYRRVQSVLRQDHREPRGEPIRCGARDRLTDLRHVSPRSALRAHGNERPDLRRATRQHRSDRCAHAHGRRLRLARRRYLPRPTLPASRRGNRFVSDTGSNALAALSSLIEQLGRCTDLDEVVTRSLDALAGFGYEHSLLLMLDDTSSSLYTIASRGYDRPGIGSEVCVGEGVIGRVAAEARPLRVNNLQRMFLYARSALRSADDGESSDTEIPLPALPSANSQLAAPAMVMGQLVGVLAVESTALGAFTKQD